MARFKLQVLAPGKRYIGRNADGSKKFFDFTPDYVKTQAERNAAMLAAGINVPVSWGHRDDALPSRLSADDRATARAKGVVGRVEKYELTAENKLFAEVDIPDDGDAKQAEKVRFCSPEINKFTDGDGKDWGQVFTHIALTPRPVQHDQVPIARLGMRLSLDPETGEDAEEKPPEEKPPEKKIDESPAPAEKLKNAVDKLNSAGYKVAADVANSFEKFLDQLIVALDTKAAADEGVEDMADEFESDDLIESTQQTSGIGGGMALSLEKQQEKAAKLARASAKREIVGLRKTGRITPAIEQELLGKLEKIRLSFSDETGDLVPNSVTAAIEAYSKLPAGVVGPKGGKGVRLGSEVTEIDPRLPNGDKDRPDESREARQERMKAVDEMLSHR